MVCCCTLSHFPHRTAKLGWPPNLAPVYRVNCSPSSPPVPNPHTLNLNPNLNLPTHILQIAGFTEPSKASDHMTRL